MSISALNLSSLADILDLPEGTLISTSGSSDAVGVSNGTLAGFGGSFLDRFLVLSTGLAQDVDGENISGNQGTDLGAQGTSGDTYTLNLNIPKPDSAAAISFDFTFLSEEFPEFVGSQFNDFFSVKLNGTEVALDLFGNPITVNNNFFNPALPASGTIFDGQTEPLKITAPLVGNASTVDIEIQIADVGDGIFDSAAFIDDFEFVEEQIFFVDFDGGTIDFEVPLTLFGYSLFDVPGTVSLPGSGLSAGEQNQM